MPTKQYKILLVEDEPDLAEMFSTALKNANFKVYLLCDGDGIVDFAKKVSPDLVLLDLVIPKKDGYQVLTDIKADKDIKNLNIYVFSNLTQKSEIDRAIKLGAKDYLVKSDYTPAKLVERVKKILKV